VTPEASPAPPPSPGPVRRAVAEKLAVLPEAPGVYKMLGASREILYIGKAINLRSRVRSYFHSGGLRELTRLLVTRIEDIDWIVVQSEKEALILENNLIKEHQPHFNINLKDNKTYPYIKITTDEAWPRAIKTRELKKGGLYFGPYTDLPVMYAFLEVLNEVYPLKKCSQARFPKGFKPCLYHHMGRCLPYCTGEVGAETTAQLTAEITAFLKGDTENAVAILTRRMKIESSLTHFERAMAIRDRIRAMEQIKERQQVVLSSRDAFDVVWPHLSDGVILFSVLCFREGKLMDKHTYPFETGLLEGGEERESSGELLREQLVHFLVQFYAERAYPVEEILIPFSPSALPAAEGDLRALLFETIRRHFRGEMPSGWDGPRLSQPLRGDRVRLLELAESNAKLSFFELRKEREKAAWGAQIRDLFGFKKAPRTVESFDIANTADRAIIAGMVHFADGSPDKSHYRIFNIRSTTRQDDFRSMHEAVHRRYGRLLAEKAPFPDLILIDGGKGQLGAATAALDELGVKNQPILSLAKQEEEVFLPGREESVKVPHDHPALRFLVKVRDETHRWVNGRHVKRRDREALESRLASIPGIGPRKIQVLFEHYDSVEAFLAAPDEALDKLPFISRSDVDALRRALQKPKAKTYKLKVPPRD